MFGLVFHFFVDLPIFLPNKINSTPSNNVHSSEFKQNDEITLNWKHEKMRNTASRASLAPLPCRGGLDFRLVVTARAPLGLFRFCLFFSTFAASFLPDAEACDVSSVEVAEGKGATEECGAADAAG